jgi:uncharacterized protein (DUF1778 family)
MKSHTSNSPGKPARQTARMRLSEADREVFLAALDNPPAPNAALRAAAALHRDSVVL